MNTIKIRKVNRDELEPYLSNEFFQVWPQLGFEIFLCAYCGSENTVILRPPDGCRKCGAPLERGCLYIGTLVYPVNERIFLKLEE